MRHASIYLKGFVLLLSVVALPSQTPAETAKADESKQTGSQDKLRSFLAAYCTECHSGAAAEANFDLASLGSPQRLPHTAARWQEVIDRLTLGDMPPPDSAMPAEAEKIAVIDQLRSEVELARQSMDGSREVVLRRLNRVEFNNTMRDLTGLDLRLADHFPADVAVDGFDNVGEALTTSPYLIEQYFEAIEEWLDEAILVQQPESGFLKLYGYRGGMGGVKLDQFRKPLSFAELSPEDQAKKRSSGKKIDDYVTKFEWNYISIPKTGRYRIRMLLSGRRSSENQPMPRLRFVVASGPVGFLTVPSPAGEQSEPRWFEIDAWLPEGVLNFRGEFLNPEPQALRKQRKKEDDQYEPTYLQRHWVEVNGPLYDCWPPDSTRRLLPPELMDRGDELRSARRVLQRFMRRAWRRPVSSAEVEPMVELFREIRRGADSFEEAIKTPLTAVLTSPHFLYLVEPANDDRQGERLDDYQLASRLSYFLWSSMPDDELLALADAEKLRNPNTLTTQFDRMLGDPKSNAFLENFVGQWLKLRQLESVRPDKTQFPRYNPWLEASMREETQSFFRELIDNNLSVLNCIDSEFTILNDELARHYGIAGVSGGDFRRVDLPAGNVRGGLLTQASILTLTADGRETSPIHRGKWILESFLNTPPPPPPPNVPDLVETGKEGNAATTIREKLRAHRSAAACAGCHQKIDPLGFALEPFDATGAFRQYKDSEGRVSTEPFGKLTGGATFDGPKEFKQVLLEHRSEVFVRGLAKDMLTYALGRPVGFPEQDQIDDIIDAVKNHEYRTRDLLKAVVTSDLFGSK